MNVPVPLGSDEARCSQDAVSNGRKSAYGANMIAFSERIVRLWFQVF